jgi:hypothetical protein
MGTSLSNLANQSRSSLRVGGGVIFCAAILWVAGCQKIERTNDPQLKPIQAMLDAQLPQGTPEANVLAFLNNRGFPVLPDGKQGTIVTTIRHIDTETVTPVTARVTFYFDANRKLNTYELQRTFNERIPQQPAQSDPAPASSAQ